MAASERRSMKLEDLLAFNDELAGLIRAGLPLDMGLRQVADSSRGGIATLLDVDDEGAGFLRARLAASSLGGISRLSHRLAERVATGISLEDALRQEGNHLPPIYVATVEAGIRAGRLAEALELLSGLGRSILELHRRATIALIYPTIVLSIAYFCFIGFVAVWIPEVLGRFYTTFGLPTGPIFDALKVVSNNVATWSWLLPLSAWVLYRVIRRLCTPATEGSQGRLLSESLQRFAWVPWMRGAIENLDRATFAKLLGLLVRHETPLPEALVLASYSTGNTKLIKAAQQISERIKAGESLTNALEDVPQLPPFMRSMLTMGERHQALDGTLWQTSDLYQRRAEKQIEFARTVLPILLSCGVGGFGTLLYAMCVFGPVWELYAMLASPLAER